MLLLISLHAAPGAILSRVCGLCLSLEAAKVAVSPMFSLLARVRSETRAVFGSHGKGHSSPIIRARNWCIDTDTQGMLARQSTSEHLAQNLLHKGLSVGFLHRKECT